MKYRYVMCGTFTPETYEYVHEDTEHSFLGIEIPAPFARDTKEEAEKDNYFTYRFVSNGEDVLIAVFSGEDCKVVQNAGFTKYLSVKTIGSPVYFYDYAKFKELGGIIFEIPNIMISKVPDIGNLSEEEVIGIIKALQNRKADEFSVRDWEVECAFKELFPNLGKTDRPVYIDNEAFCISAE